MIDSLPYFAFQVLQIVWLDLLLSGDNAVVIALACRNLPEDKRKLGIALGAGMAVALRILFTLLVVWLLKLPFLKLIGGVLLLYIAVRLVFDNHEHGEVKAEPNVWGAVTTIMIADGVMSLDNVLAIVGVSEGHFGLIVFGLLLSIPLVVFGAGFVLKLVDRWPVIVWAGAALLGWVAGEMISEDPWVANWLDRHGDPPDVVAAITGAVVVLAIAGAIKLARKRKA
ncbi:MAG TPA: TerC family protein [Rhodoblastus sp.]|nr:TerC family protein [Rhodoblastus sp.]